MNQKQWIITGSITALIAIVAIAVVYYYYFFQPVQFSPPPSTPPPFVAKHIFKAKEIYPTKPGGREWFTWLI
jgi:hypothetical protein